MESLLLFNPRYVKNNRLDVILLTLLWILTLLFQVAAYHYLRIFYYIRVIILIYLYFRFFCFYLQSKIPINFFWLLIFLAYATMLAFYTGFQFNKEIAFFGFARFANVALLAPLIATIISDRRQIDKLIIIYLVIVFIGVLTCIYQSFGGDLSWLFGHYDAMRGGFHRYETILGNPNASGVAGTMLCLASLIWLNRLWIKVIALMSGVTLVILSLSKAALLLLIAITLVGTIRVFIRKKCNKTTSNCLIICVLIFFAFLISIFMYPPLEKTTIHFVITQVESVKGVAGSNPHSFKRGLVTDVKDRLFFGVILAVHKSKQYNASHLKFIINSIFGNGYGLAGSAAASIKGKNSNAFLPHNGILEIYIDGGLIMLFVFFRLLYGIYRQFWELRFYVLNRNSLFFFISFLILTVYMFFYPVIYEPTLGALFWLITGYYSNARLMTDALTFPR